VKSATFGGKPVEVAKTGKYGHEVVLPEKFVPPFDTTVEVAWTVPLSALQGEPNPKFGPYRVRLKSLLPANSLSLMVVVEPDSGFEISGGVETDKQWTYPFYAMSGLGVYRQSWGTCSLCIGRASRDKDGQNGG